MKRAILGMLGGAVFCGVVAALIPTLFVGIIPYFVDVHPIDRERDLANFSRDVTFCAICGIVVGALAGLASRAPTLGIPFLRCCIFIGLSAGIVRLLTAPIPKISPEYQFYLSYILTLIVAVITTAILTWVGFNRRRRNHNEGLPAGA